MSKITVSMSQSVDVEDLARQISLSNDNEDVIIGLVEELVRVAENRDFSDLLFERLKKAGLTNFS